MVAPARALRFGNRGHGRPCYPPAESVSLSGDLDFAALDSRDRTRFANADWGADSCARCCASDASRVEHAAMGHFASYRCCVGHIPAALRSRREQTGWYLLWGQDIWRYRDGIAHVLMGPSATGPRLRDRFHPLSSRPKCLSSVGSPGPCGGARSSCSKRQDGCVFKISRERAGKFAAQIRDERDSDGECPMI